MTTPFAPGVAVPDKIESSIGTLNLNYGYPSADTVEKIYDNLDRSRALQAYLLAIPIVNQAGMRDSIRKFGPDNQTDVIWEDLVDPRTVELTANDNTIYNFIWIDTSQGAAGPRDSARGAGWRSMTSGTSWVADVGITGEDRGKGGKYLVLPPGYKGDMPPGYIVVRPEHLRQLVLLPRLPGRRLDQARRRIGEEAPQDLSALRRRQSAADEVRQCLGRSGQLRRPG
jgi:hypothetical protein